MQRLFVKIIVVRISKLCPKSIPNVPSIVMYYFYEICSLNVTCAWVDLKNKIQEIDKVKRNWWDMFTFNQIANSARIVLIILEKELNDQTTSKTPLLNDTMRRWWKPTQDPFVVLYYVVVQGVTFGCLLISKREILEKLCIGSLKSIGVNYSL